MPWVEAFLRGQKVLARANADRSLASDGGRVEVRYRATDTRAYRAGVRNLSVPPDAKLLPDDACPEAEFVPSRTETQPGAPATSTRATTTEGGGSTKGRAAPSSKAKAAPKPAARPAGPSWIAYTDGACSGNPGPAGSGMVLVMPDGVMREGYEYLGTATNNIAELTAILRALEAIPRDATPIVVHTDSQYAIGVLTKGWRPKVNQELIATIKAALAARPSVSLVYVPGHAGVPLNERADELARTAIRDGRSAPLRV